jgi:ABC-type dipeptide/oligopeptide/nickel transport system permease subunit
MNEPHEIERGRLGSWALAIRRDRKGLIGACLLCVFSLVAIAWAVVRGLAVGAGRHSAQPPGWAHPLGTNGQGQDVLAQVVVGTRCLAAARLRRSVWRWS